MEFNEVLKNGCYCLRLNSDTKEDIIEEMVDLLVDGGKIKGEDRAAVLQAVREREKKMSTGVQHGVAIPHGKSDVVEELVTAVALKPEGIDFRSLDGEPSRIFIMTVSSVLRSGPHLQYLAEISKILNVPSFRERILKVETVDDLVGLLTNPESARNGSGS